MDSLLLQPGDLDLLDLDGGASSFTLDPGPDETTVYTLEATRGEETGIATTRVVLLPPEIVSFSADRTLVSPGTEVTFSWEVTPPYTSLILQPGDIDVLGNTDASGIGSVAITPEASATYQLIATIGPSASSLAEELVQVHQPRQGIMVAGVDIETNDAWRTSDVVKPFGDTDNVYGTDGYFIAQAANGDPLNLSAPSYATVDLVGGLRYEGQGAETHQSVFDDVVQPRGSRTNSRPGLRGLLAGCRRTGIGHHRAGERFFHHYHDPRCFVPSRSDHRLYPGQSCRASL